jgi:hypothetical protein
MFRSLCCAALLMLIAGCSSIQIDEGDVFLPKPSVTPASFDRDGVTLDVQDIAVTDSVRLNAWHLTQPEARGTVLFFGGNGFYLVQSRGYIDAITRHPVDAFMYDYRGYGRSGGSPSVSALKQDAVALYDSLTQRAGIDPNRLVVHGHSLGAFLALHLAEERPVAGVALENPATNVDEWVSSLAPWYVRMFVSFEVDADLRGESNLKRVRVMDAIPLLVVGGEEDNVTPPAMARRLHDEASTPQKQLVIVEGGSHNELYETDVYQQAYTEWLNRSLPPDISDR